MANTSRPMGFRPVGTMSGSPWQGAVRAFKPEATSNIFPGDMVLMTTNGTVDIATSASAELVGVMVGKILGAAVNTTSNLIGDGALGTGDLKLSKKYYDTADGLSWILVAVGPDVLYEVQADGTTAYTAIGANCDLLATAGSTVTGVSQQQISSTVSTATTSGIRIVAFSQRIDNDITASNSKWIVRINQNHYTKLGGV